MLAITGFAFLFIVLASAGIYLLERKNAEQEDNKQSFNHSSVSAPSDSSESYRKPRFFNESKMDDVDQYPDYSGNSISSPESNGVQTRFKDY